MTLNAESLTFATRTVIVKGIELDYPEKLNPYNGQVLHPAGTVFVSFDILSELMEADKSWGMGGAFLIYDNMVAWALESAGLVTRETRGGYHTTEEQRDTILAIFEAWNH